MKLYVPWTEAEIGQLRRAAADGISLKAASRFFPDRTIDAVRRKANNEGIQFVSRHFAGQRVSDPDLANLQVVESRNTTSITAFVFGDPPPGRSALDQRRQ